MDLHEQYDRIYRYLYFRLHDRHTAEDLTQETFLRFLASRTYRDENRQMQYLYMIARNLCNQYYRDRTVTFSLDEARDHPTAEGADGWPSEGAARRREYTQSADGFEQALLERIILTEALQKLSDEEREMLFLRYINEVPVPVMSGLYKISRFAVYRKLKGILKKLRNETEKEGQDAE